MTLNRRTGTWLVATALCAFAIGESTAQAGLFNRGGGGSCGSFGRHASHGSYGRVGSARTEVGRCGYRNHHHSNYNSCGSHGRTPVYASSYGHGCDTCGDSYGASYANDCGCATAVSHTGYHSGSQYYGGGQGYDQGYYNQQGYQSNRQRDTYQDVPPPPPGDDNSSNRGSSSRSAADGGSPPPPPGSGGQNRSGGQSNQQGGNNNNNSNNNADQL